MRVCRAKKVQHRLEQPPTPTEDISDDELFQELIISFIYGKVKENRIWNGRLLHITCFYTSPGPQFLHSVSEPLAKLLQV